VFGTHCSWHNPTGKIQWHYVWWTWRPRHWTVCQSIFLEMSCLGARVPAQSPFHKQLTEKHKDGLLCHLLVATKTSRVSLWSGANRMWLAQFVCAPQIFKTPKGLCGHTVRQFGGRPCAHLLVSSLWWLFVTVYHYALEQIRCRHHVQERLQTPVQEDRRKKLSTRFGMSQIGIKLCQNKHK
jgi:hypothetical protein